MNNIVNESTNLSNERIISLLEELNSTLDLYYEDTHDHEFGNIER